MTDEQHGFEVIDKRGTDSAAPEAAETPEDLTGEQQASEDPTGSIVELLTYIISLLGATAWQWMGLIVNPATGKAEMDLRQARIAIDTFEAITTQLKPLLDPSSGKDLENALADLKVNFVERAKSSEENG